MSAHKFYETVTESDVSSYHGNLMNAETGDKYDNGMSF